MSPPQPAPAFPKNSQCTPTLQQQRFEQTVFPLQHLTHTHNSLLCAVCPQDDMPTLLQCVNRDTLPEYLHGLLSTRFRHFIHECARIDSQVCPRDYVPTLLQYIDRDNLPEYLGGTSKATLLDDAGPWNDRTLIDDIEADLKRVGARQFCLYLVSAIHVLVVTETNKWRRSDDRTAPERPGA